MAQPHQSTSLTEYAVKLEQQLSSAFELASKTYKKQKQCYDKKVHGDLYVVGNLVWVLNPKVTRRSYFILGMDLLSLLKNCLNAYTGFKDRKVL